MELVVSGFTTFFILFLSGFPRFLRVHEDRVSVLVDAEGIGFGRLRVGGELLEDFGRDLIAFHILHGVSGNSGEFFRGLVVLAQTHEPDDCHERDVQDDGKDESDGNTLGDFTDFTHFISLTSREN